CNNVSSISLGSVDSFELTLALRQLLVPSPRCAGEFVIKGLVTAMVRDGFRKRLDLLMLYKRLCNLRGTCETDWSHLPQEHLLIPEIHSESKCSPSTFEKEGCLELLAEGLFSFRIFLEYLQETLFPKKPELTQYLWPATEFLANNLKSQLKNPDCMQPIPDAIDDDLAHKLAMHTGWTPAILRHTILRRYLMKKVFEKPHFSPQVTTF
uniref:Interleukin-6 n=1 Tax=Podarcis muralis TaxID=64176 RepID=A0A670HLX4_PODMU